MDLLVEAGPGGMVTLGSLVPQVIDELSGLEEV